MENSKYGTVRMWDISKGGAWETPLEKAAGQTMYEVPAGRAAFVRVDNVVDFTAWKAAHEDVDNRCDGYEDDYGYDGYEDDCDDEPYLRPADYEDPSDDWDVCRDPHIDDDEEVDLREVFRSLKDPVYVDPKLYAEFLRQEAEEAEAEAAKAQRQETRDQVKAGPRWLQNLLTAGELAATGVVLAVGIALLCKVLLG